MGNNEKIKYDTPYGYYLGAIYIGRMPNGDRIDTPTEGEYLEMFQEELEELKGGTQND